jgi:hypothetical protein
MKMRMLLVFLFLPYLNHPHHLHYSQQKEREME